MLFKYTKPKKPAVAVSHRVIDIYSLTPLSGFETHFLYEDYSAPFLDNKHYRLAGGAWVSSGYSTSPFYRNWFRPYFYQHAGFRLAQLTQKKKSYYERIYP